MTIRIRHPYYDMPDIVFEAASVEEAAAKAKEVFDRFGGSQTIQAFAYHIDQHGTVTSTPVCTLRPCGR